MAAWYHSLLACPDCGAPLPVVNGGVHCAECGFADATVHDLRPRRPRPLETTFSRTVDFEPDAVLRTIPTVGPEITYSGPQAIRDSRELMSAISAHMPAPSSVLDLGCGPRDQEAPIEHLGHRYVGVDIVGARAQLLADGHALPFQSGVLGCVLSYAVFQHFHNPFVAIREVERVLAPGGIFVGTMSQGEPFAQSYFHPTAWGFLSLLATTRSLRPLRLWAAIDTLSSLARMGRYSRVLRLGFRALHTINVACPFLAPRKMRWPSKDRQIDAVYRAGSIAFVVQKVGDAASARG